jgi:hypothetical protein
MVMAGERSMAWGVGHEKVRGFGHTHTSVSDIMKNQLNVFNAFIYLFFFLRVFW